MDIAPTTHRTSYFSRVNTNAIAQDSNASTKLFMILRGFRLCEWREIFENSNYAKFALLKGPWGPRDGPEKGPPKFDCSSFIAEREERRDEMGRSGIQITAINYSLGILDDAN